MFELLENLRRKPLSFRRRVALLTSFTFVSIIFVIWVSVIYPDFKKDQKLKQAAQVEEAASNNAPTPVKSIGENLNQGFSGIGEKFGELKQTVYSIFEFSSEAASYNSASNTASTTGE
jgi:hypothetical protein